MSNGAKELDTNILAMNTITFTRRCVSASLALLFSACAAQRGDQQSTSASTISDHPTADASRAVEQSSTSEAPRPIYRPNRTRWINL